MRLLFLSQVLLIAPFQGWNIDQTSSSRGTNIFYANALVAPGFSDRYSCNSPHVLQKTFLAGESPRITSVSLAASVASSADILIPNSEDSSVSSTANTSPTETSSMAGRAAEVVSVATLDVVLPLISSLFEASFLGEIQQGTSSWDDFWSYSSSSSTTTTTTHLSNSDRVSRALERLGPTYVKFGQALSSRGDIIPPTLANSLTTLQDRMEPFDTTIAKSIIRAELVKEANVDEETVEKLLKSLSNEPVAAASVGQVYRGHVDGFGEVAVKVQRPGVREMVEKDAALLNAVAEFLESIPALPAFSSEITGSSLETVKNTKVQSRFIETELVAAVGEFMSRVFEELDFKREASNAERFASLYSDRGGTALKTLADRRGVVVPEILRKFSTTNVIVMEWIDGKKIANEFNPNMKEAPATGSAAEANEEKRKENLELIKMVIDITLNQLIDTGVMHADPHGGNLLKVDDLNREDYQKKRRKKGTIQKKIAYLDFGLLSVIDPQVSDALVCSISQLIFANDVEAVASLFGELQLIPDDVINDPSEVAALTEDLSIVLNECLDYSSDEDDDEALGTELSKTRVPKLKFDKLLDGLTRLVPRFQFRLPPYFVNNCRALGTLEGTARSLDPEFNVMTVLYPYALNRLIRNPTGSPVVDRTVQNLIRSEKTGRVDHAKLSKLLRDSSALTGKRKTKLLWDVLKTRKGRGLVMRVTAEEMHHRVFRGCFGRMRKSKMKKERRRRVIVSDYLRL
mmetsp:Transcript_18429/g.27490  ORF Transcript_18429/g.27490 Transcript_18429/m.27490 type:complete len:744 (-) Transcript_18429:316-2547(-)